jgi:hypothetical protein
MRTGSLKIVALAGCCTLLISCAEDSADPATEGVPVERLTSQILADWAGFYA